MSASCFCPLGYSLKENTTLRPLRKKHNQTLLTRGPDEGMDKAELLHSNSWLWTLYTDLQQGVEMAEDSNTLLKTENIDLKNKLRSMSESIQNFQLLVNELEDIRAAKTEKDQVCDAVESSRKELAKENEALRQQVEALISETSSFLLEKEQQEDELSKLSCFLKVLQEQLEENKLHLEQKDEVINQRDCVIEQLKDSVSEYITINQDMKEKLKDLEEQLALALVSGEGTFMNVDTTLELTPERCVSLREELRVLSEEDQVLPNPEEEQTEEEEEENAETLKEQAARNVSESCWKGNIRKGASAAVALCFSVLSVFGVLSPTVLTDVLDTVRHLIIPYARLYHTSLPPL